MRSIGGWFGERLPGEWMSCNRCGQKVPDGSDFCTSCGADLRGASRMTPTPGGTPPLGTPPAGRPHPRDSVFAGTTYFRPEVAGTLEAGHVVADRYEVLAKVGRGGMGVVYRVRARELDVIVRVMRQVLEVLSYAREHTTHRDIKPENIFLIGEARTSA